MTDDRVTLQISVAPPDLPHARETLPHQLRQWGAQVDELLFVLDLGPAARPHPQRSGIEQLLQELCDCHPSAALVLVDYGAVAAGEVSRRFFGGRAVPRIDCYGKVVYPYFFALLAAKTRFVLHLDSDMMFGGGSQAWVAEAKRLFAARHDVFSCSPLGGPPGDEMGLAGGRQGAAPFESAAVDGPALRFSHLSTRDLMLDRSLLHQGRLTLKPGRPGMRATLASSAKGALVNRRPWRPPAEAVLSRAMTAAGLMRVDFLGRAPGMWSLHPPQRSAAFYDALPGLIERVEAGDVPAGQRGDFDLNESMLA